MQFPGRSVCFSVTGSPKRAHKQSYQSYDTNDEYVNNVSTKNGKKKKKKERKSTKSLYANKINQSKSATPTTWNIRPSVSLTSSAHFKISTTTLAVWLENSTSAHMWNTNAENPHVTIEQKYNPSMGDKEALQHGQNALKQAFVIKWSTLLILSASLPHQPNRALH